MLFAVGEFFKTQSSPMLEERVSTDEAVQEQHKLVTELQASPYFRGFNPRVYPSYPGRHFDPKAFLNQVGIEKIGELVQHGLSLGQISALLDISSRVIRRWIQADSSRGAEIDEARRFAADEERATARAVLYDSKTHPDTARAKAIADHHQWTAERWDKELYGTKNVRVDATLGIGISYNFNLKGREPEAPVKKALEGTYELVDALPAARVEELLRPSLDFTEEDSA